MDLLGKSYIIDHCVMELDRYYTNEWYRTYITDALHAIALNTNMSVNEFASMATRYSDALKQSEEEDDEVDNEEKAKEIINNMKSILTKLSRKEVHGGPVSTESSSVS